MLGESNLPALGDTRTAPVWLMLSYQTGFGTKPGYRSALYCDQSDLVFI